MNIQLSIIVPHHNHYMSLLKLLDSVLEQTYKDFEVIIVDDCSDVSPRPIVEGYLARGLAVRLVEQSERGFTKNARLAGIEAAKGEFVTFIDADDWFHGTDGLARLMQIMQKRHADILHFGCYLYHWHSGEYIVNEEEKPYADELYGSKGFEYYCLENKTKSHCVWGKIYLRSLLLQCLPVAKAITIHRYCEDYFFYTLCAFHSQHYIGVDIPLYVYRAHSDEKKRVKNKRLGRIITMEKMENVLLGYFYDHGCPSHVLAALRKILASRQRTHARQFLEAAQKDFGRKMKMGNVKGLLQGIEPEDALRVLLINAPIKPSSEELDALQAKYQRVLRQTRHYRGLIQILAKIFRINKK